MLKKLLAAALALLLACACAFAEPETDRDDELIALAQEMAERMTALCGVDAYVSLFSGAGDIRETVRGWAGDWAQRENCRRAVVAFVDEETVSSTYTALIEAIAANVPGAEAMGELEPLGDLVIPRLAGSVPNLLNASGGAVWIAAASMMACSDARVLEGVEPGYAYALLDYFGPDHPLALASFRIRENGMVGVSVMFVPRGELTDTVFGIASGAVDLRRLASDALAEQPPQLARAVLDALDVISMTEVYF